MKIVYALLLFSISTLLGCNSSEEKHDEQNKQNNLLYKSNSRNNFTKDFYKRFEGTVAGKKVVMNISCFDREYYATYYYVDQPGYVTLYQNRDTTLNNDSIQFFEDNKYKGDNNDGEATWQIIFTNNKANGTWTHANGKTSYPIALTENYPSGCTRFNVVSSTDSLRIPLKSDTVGAFAKLMALEPLNKKQQQLLLSTLSDKPKKSNSTKAYLDDAASSFLNDYKDEFDTLTKNGSIEDSGTHYWLNYTLDGYSQIIYNDNNFVVMSVVDYVYMGGAHGMQHNALHCFDMSNNKLLTLKDIVNIDSVTLQTLIEKNFRLQQHMQPGDSLNTILFENMLAANENFYFTHQGLGFIYQPYEVAAYVYGFVEPVVPFKELKPYLNPEFARRMGLLTN